MEYFILALVATCVIVLWIVMDMDTDEDTGSVPVPQPEPVEPVPDFESMTKLELLEYAEENNILVKKSWNKQRILAKVMDPDAFGNS